MVAIPHGDLSMSDLMPRRHRPAPYDGQYSARRGRDWRALLPPRTALERLPIKRLIHRLGAVDCDVLHRVRRVLNHVLEI